MAVDHPTDTTADPSLEDVFTEELPDEALERSAFSQGIPTCGASNGCSSSER